MYALEVGSEEWGIQTNWDLGPGKNLSPSSSTPERPSGWREDSTKFNKIKKKGRNR